MKKIIFRLFRERERVFNVVGLTLVALLIVGGWFWSNLETLVIYPEYATAATSSAVTVSADVVATISCASNQTSTAFGTLTSSAVATSTPNASSTMSCTNSSGGCTLYVKDAGGGGNPGLWNSVASYLVPSVSSTLVAATEGYGINATTTATGGGATLTIPVHYRLNSDASTSTVGGFTIANQSLAVANSSSSSREVVVRHKASISASTVAGSYSDTITYECTAN